MSERLVVRVTGETALDAINAAKAWLAGEPRWRLRTVASVKRAFGPNGEPTSAWVVALAVVERGLAT